MPAQIGEFISDAVYGGQLMSNPEHKHAEALACFFVEIPTSQESLNNTSYQVSLSLHTLFPSLYFALSRIKQRQK